MLKFNRTWSKETFQASLKKIQHENPDKPFKYHTYGVFQNWKTNDTNFLEVATQMLNPKNESNQSVSYISCVHQVQDEWHTFCSKNGIPKYSKLSDRWANREISKVNNWIEKNAQTTLDK